MAPKEKSIAELNHDQAGAILLNDTPLATLQRAVIDEAAQVGISGITLEQLTIDTDVPIPFILEVDFTASFQWRKSPLSAASDDAWLYLDIWGEAYDGNYGTRVRVRRKGTSDCIFSSPPNSPAKCGDRRWELAATKLADSLGYQDKGEYVAQLLAAGISWPLNEIWLRMLRFF